MINAQLIQVGTGPPIYFTKKYILENNIKSMTFDENYGYKKGKPNQQALYTVYFDSIGVAKTAVCTDITRRGNHTYEVQIVDTLNLDAYDTILYDNRDNVTKTSFYRHEHYYYYDNKNRIISELSFTPQIGEFIFNRNSTVYDKDGNVSQTSNISGRCKVPFEDSLVQSKSVQKFIFENDRTISLIDTDYEEEKVKTVSGYTYEYNEGKLTRIMEEHSDSDPEYFYINVIENR